MGKIWVNVLTEQYNIDLDIMINIHLVPAHEPTVYIQTVHVYMINVPPAFLPYTI